MCCLLAAGVAAQPVSAAPLGARDLALIVNSEDPSSVSAAHVYQQARGVPPENVVKVSIAERDRTLAPDRFEELRRQIDAALPKHVQAVLFMWTSPYAVGCNSLTSAFSLGYDADQCVNTCAPGKASRYFDSASRRPYTEVAVRISMLMPTHDGAIVKALIDRGRMAAFRVPEATAYFVVTADPHRNSRAVFFPQSRRLALYSLNISTFRGEALVGKQDVMLYQTGATSVPHLETLQFLPGALADHLTSAGGDLLRSSQMSSLRWLEAGATASYGTVSEPCNHWQKFPNSAVLLRHYLAGDTAIEAYWKSVAWPAQGLFIGEPLAAPYAPFRARTVR